MTTLKELEKQAHDFAEEVFSFDFVRKFGATPMDKYDCGCTSDKMAKGCPCTSNF